MFNFLKKKSTTLFHITHWKAGSQWIHRILNYCAHDRIIPPQLDPQLFLKAEILPGKIYPTLYLSYHDFIQAALPKDYKYFVVIRDLRDVLVSLYFSLKISHTLKDDGILFLRNILAGLKNEDDALIFLMEKLLGPYADIQYSWHQVSQPLIRYEDLLERDVEILTPILMDGLAISKRVARQAIEANRFEVITQGRKRGQEDVSAHERKGIPGDLKNHFSDRVKQEFKQKYGDLLIKTGYESNNNW